MKKRIEIYLVMLLLLLSGFIVGCSKEDNILKFIKIGIYIRF